MADHHSPFGQDRFGRAAEAAARFFGTPQYIVAQTIAVAAWIALNSIALVRHWDPYPFILLNLVFSTQAAYAAPLILLAQNRQEDRDRVIYERDRLANSRAHADMEFLAREMASLRMALGEVATRDYVRSELRSLLHDLDERTGRGERGEDDREEGDGGRGGSEPDRRLDP